MRKFLYTILIILSHEQINAQENFHKIYVFDEPFAVSQGIFVTDSCYYIGASEGQGNEVDILLGKMNLQGEVINTSKITSPGEFDGAVLALSGLTENYKGNFMFGYTDRISGLGWYPKIVEMSPDGVAVNEFLYDYFYDDSLSFEDNGKVITYNADSSYYGFFSYLDYTTDSDPNVGFDGEYGAMLLKINYLGDTLWTKRFYHPSLSFGRPGYLVYGMNFLDVNRILLSIVEFKSYGGSQADQEWSKIHYLEVDLNGNLLSSWEFQDTQFCWPGMSVLPLSDGSFVHTYLESQLTGTPPNGDYFWHRPVISRVDENFQQLWKYPLVPTFANGSPNGIPHNLALVNDSVIAGAYSWYDIDWETYKHDISVRMFNRHINGNELWHRDYHFFSIGDSLNASEYLLKDFQLTPDGGYITCGAVNNFDSLAVGNSGQYAYVLKTNCLGFLGEPEAAANHSIEDDFNVTFYNTSTQAGSYTWYFGDGESLMTDEYTDTVSHTFPGFGPFEVMLIAHGCNGIADTLIFEVNPAKHNDPSVITNGNGYFTLFPNPVLSGSTLFVYLNGLNPKDGEVYLLIHSSNGKLVDKIMLNAAEGNYLINANLSAGMYHVSLFQEEKFLQSRKLIVE